MADDHNQQLARLQSEIAALQQAIASLEALPDAQQPLKAQLTDKEQQLAQLQTGGVNLGQGNAIGQTGDIIAGNKFGGDQVLRDKIINQFSLASHLRTAEFCCATTWWPCSKPTRRCASRS
jgi:hypothetical protein